MERSGVLGLQGLSGGGGEPLGLLEGEIGEFWRIVMRCFGGAPLVGMTAVLV